MTRPHPGPLHSRCPHPQPLSHPMGEGSLERKPTRAAREQIRRQHGEGVAILAGADFVEQFAQAVEVSLRTARAFGRNESFRAHIRTGFARLGHQPNVRQLGHATHEDDVRRLDVAMHQTVPVQVRERFREREPDADALGGWKAAVTGEVGGEGAGGVSLEFRVSSFEFRVSSC